MFEEELREKDKGLLFLKCWASCPESLGGFDQGLSGFLVLVEKLQTHRRRAFGLAFGASSVVVLG